MLKNYVLSKLVDEGIYFHFILVWKGVSQSYLERVRGQPAHHLCFDAYNISKFSLDKAHSS